MAYNNLKKEIPDFKKSAIQRRLEGHKNNKRSNPGTISGARRPGTPIKEREGEGVANNPRKEGPARPTTLPAKERSK